MLSAADEDTLRRCRAAGAIDDAQVARARHEAQARRARGEAVVMATLLYGLGFIDQGRALTLLHETSLVAALRTVGPYTVLESVGAGGMGEVHRALAADGATVALKLLPPRVQGDAEADRRFRREARIGGRIDHPHVVRVLGAGSDHGRRWLAMELVPGPSLRERLRGGPLAPDHALVLLAQMALGLRAASRRGVLHRDIKPANILLAPPRPGRAEPFCAKLCDFGLAKGWLAADAAAPGGSTLLHLTANGVVVGTPAYMSPEQAAGERDLDQRSDVYALGATLFHALTGEPVHGGADSVAVMVQQVRGEIDLYRLHECQVPAPFAGLLGRMLAKDRARRLAGWDEVVDALQALDPALSAAVAAGEHDRQRPPRRVPWLWLGGGGAFAALGGAAWWLLNG